LIKVFDEMGQELPIGMATYLKTDIEEFREHLWIIESLTTDAMRNPKKSLVHWQEIFQKTEVKSLDLNDELSLQKIIESGLNVHREVLEEVSRKAEKQWSLEKKLKEIEDKAKQINLEMLLYKKTGTYCLQSVDDVF